jgi:hypothetical protein
MTTIASNNHSMSMSYPLDDPANRFRAPAPATSGATAS